MCLCCAQGPFVAAFAQSNEGDVSPNTKGPHCLDSGIPCDILHSTCHGKVKGRGGAKRVGGAESMNRPGAWVGQEHGCV